MGLKIHKKRGYRIVYLSNFYRISIFSGELSKINKNLDYKCP
jgi:hypothetical protein